MEYITITHATIHRIDEEDFLVDDFGEEIYREMDKVIERIVEMLKEAGYEMNLTYRLEVDGYAPD